MRLAIQGIGVVASFGGKNELLGAAVGTTQPIPLRKTHADTSPLEQMYSPRQLRRIDHFTRMCLLAARQALADSTADQDLGFGIILCSGYGPAQTTFDFLDSLIDFGETCASPLAFSHSVHNIPAATLSILLGQSCPCLSLCQTDMPISSGLNAAGAWLAEGRSHSVLFIAVDERTLLLEQVSDRLIAESHPPLRAHLPIGDGAVAFMLTLADSGRYGCVGFDSASDQEVSAVSLKHLYGRIPVAAAFDLAAVAMLRRKHSLPANCRENGPRYSSVLVVD
jgi:3-oxoacyl-[acyl-carrier-protein] synthase II